MKFLKIFGFVVGIHAAVFLFVFAIPGCRSPAVKAPGAAPAAATSVAPASAPFNPDAPATPRPQRPDAAATRPPVPVVVAPVAPAPPPPAAVETYTVKSGDNLWNLARARGLTAAEIAAANNLSVNSVLHVGQRLQLPAKAATSAAPATSPAPDAAGTTGYVVRSGDTLGGIARRHGTSAEALRTLNNLRGDTIRVGDRLRVPLTPGGAVAPSPAPVAASAGGGVTHIVKAGENLDAIASLYGVRRRDIEVANSLANPNSLRAGQVLSIPGFQVKTPAVTSPVSPAPPPPTQPPSAAPVSPAPPPPAATLPPLPPVNFGPGPAPVAPSSPPPPVVPRTGPQITIEPDTAPRIRQDGAR
jgi:LysM repeat protein